MADVKKINGYNIKDANARERLNTIENELNTENTGLIDRVSNIESELNTPNTGLSDRVGTLEDTINTPETGLSDKIDALEDELNSVGTGLSDRVELLESENSYSTTEEVMAGTWVDGKPFYKKTYVGSFNGEKKTIDLPAPANIDKFLGVDHSVVKVQSTLEEGVTADIWEVLPSRSASDYYKISFLYNETSKLFELNAINNGTNPYDYIFIALYTKTTDTPNV